MKPKTLTELADQYVANVKDQDLKDDLRSAFVHGWIMCKDAILSSIKGVD